ncbi:hypothetical protein PUN28_015494 [Cardiocondyla obscurior]|uniref:Uncharacterized protein n=1 Tax=Cardiocondyla obscurior TaxID=286306 RepID=A0AAW2EZE0_9HYME
MRNYRIQTDVRAAKRGRVVESPTFVGARRVDAVARAMHTNFRLTTADSKPKLKSLTVSLMFSQLITTALHLADATPSRASAVSLRRSYRQPCVECR